MTSSISVSCLSGLPYSHPMFERSERWRRLLSKRAKNGPLGIEYLIALARRLEVGLQLNPLIGLEEGACIRLKRAGISVVSVEFGSWLPEGFWSFVYKVGWGGDAGAILSPLLFGKERNAQTRSRVIAEHFPHALRIEGPPEDPRSAVETSSRFDHQMWDTNAYLACRKVVFDPKHAKETPKLIPDPTELFAMLITQGKLALFHFQPASLSELDRFLDPSPSGNELIRIWLLLALRYGVDVVVELNPVWTWLDPSLLERTVDQIRKERDLVG